VAHEAKHYNIDGMNLSVICKLIAQKSSTAIHDQGVSKAVIMGGVPPFLLKTEDNPEGVNGSVFEGIKKAVAADRYAFFTEFYKNFYNTDQLLGKRVSEEVVKASWQG